MEACLHVAVKPNQIDVLIHLLKWVTGERPDLLHVFAFKDYRGITVLELLQVFASKGYRGITILELLQNGYAQTTDEPANYCEKELNGLLIWNYKFANLLLACKMGYLEMVEELIIENRILCFEKDGFGKTALHIAAENGKVDVINLIIIITQRSAYSKTNNPYFLPLKPLRWPFSPENQ
ncbi:unnamed protein product [Camellia sinensis]